VIWRFRKPTAHCGITTFSCVGLRHFRLESIGDPVTSFFMFLRLVSVIPWPHTCFSFLQSQSAVLRKFGFVLLLSLLVMILSKALATAYSAAGAIPHTSYFPQKAQHHRSHLCETSCTIRKWPDKAPSCAPVPSFVECRVCALFFPPVLLCLKCPGMADVVWYFNIYWRRGVRCAHPFQRPVP